MTSRAIFFRVCGLAWLALLASAAVCYAPGLTGGFLFDDFANLAPLGWHGSVRSVDTLWAYLRSGFAGPTGRPVALLSFLLDARTWPADPWPFKRTNLVLHLLCGTAVLGCSLRIARALGHAERTVWPIALTGAALWLLHPLWVSTTLYVVQRMAQLSALFVLLALLGWLHGRALLPRAPRRAYAWMTGSVLLGSLLAVLSKENGALLPMLVGVVEWVLATSPAPSGVAQRPGRWWRLIFLVLPSVALCLYLLSQINFAADAWPHRAFTQPQRLWTEARIVWVYLGQLWWPGVGGWGFFQDAFPISTGWLTPATTLLSVLGLLALLIAGVLLRRRLPLISLAVLFFLAGHLLESSTIGLELYFEHRNYLPAAFLFLPVGQLVAWGFWRQPSTWSSAAPALMLGMGCIAACALLLHARATHWADTDRLQLGWAQQHPESARGQDVLVDWLAKQGRIDEAQQVLTDALNRMPQDGLLNVRAVWLRISLHEATTADFDRLAQVLAAVRLDAQVANGVAVLVDLVRDQRPVNLDDVKGMQVVLRGLQGNPRFAASAQARYLALQQGLLHLTASQWPEAREQLTKAMAKAAHPGIALRILSELATHGQFCTALDLVPQAKGIVESTPARQLRAARGTYVAELERMAAALQSDAEDCRAMQHPPGAATSRE